MRLGIVIPSMTSGGAERVAANLANAWAERTWSVSLVTLATRSLDFYSLDHRVRRVALDVVGDRFVGIPRRRTLDSLGMMKALWANVRRVRALRRVLVELQPDAVIAMLSTAGVLAILASRGLRCRVVVAERTYPPMLPVNVPWAILRRLTYPLAYRVSMQTSEGLRWLREKIPRARGVVIPNPVSYPLPVGDPVVLPERVIPKESRLLLAVGRLDGGKQFDRVIASFAQLGALHRSWHLAILGDGPERASLERQVAALGLGDRIRLPGRVGNICDWYCRADLFVMSSRYEGFPNTLAEAMAYGCPAVSYDCDTGPRDIIRHEVDGLLVRPVGDVPALSQAMGRLMANEAERVRMAARAIEVRDRYSMDRVLTMWEGALAADERS